jgi:hypothetical protein
LAQDRNRPLFASASQHALGEWPALPEPARLSARNQLALQIPTGFWYKVSRFEQVRATAAFSSKDVR